MCQYLSKFCHNLIVGNRSSTEELDKRELWTLVVKQPWKGIQLSQESHCMSDCTTLLRSYYSRNSASGCGGVLLQNGQPVCFTWHTLNNTEENYLKRSILPFSLACIRGTFMENTTLRYDHQPLETIFKKPLFKTPRRLQRMMLKLQRYSFQFRTKKEGTKFLMHLLLITQC